MRARAALLVVALPAAARAEPSLEDFLSSKANPDERVVPAQPEFAVSLTPGGPPLERARPPWRYGWLDVVGMAGDRPRVVFHGGGVGLAVYLEPGSLATIAVVPTVISPGDDGVGVYLRPGQVLRVGDDGRVSFSNGDITAAGSIDRASIGTLYDIHADKGGWAQAPDATAPADALFLDQPLGSRSVARLDKSFHDGLYRDGSGRALVKRLGPWRQGHSLVSYVGRGGAVRVVGWLPEAQLERYTPPDEEGGGVVGGVVGALHEPRRSKGLAQGIRLYDAPGGQLVGMTYAPVVVEPLEKKDGWTSWPLTVEGLKVVVWTQDKR